MTNSPSPPERIYLDNAATSWPKPDAVYDAVDRYQRENGAPAGRSSYQEADETARGLADARRGVAKLLGVPRSQNVIFTFNGTDSLNLALHGLLQPGGHVLTTMLEHNSVLRPLRHWEQQTGGRVTRLRSGPDTLLDPDDFRRELQPDTQLIAVTHVSNVTGSVQPIAEIAALAAEAERPLLVDAAQSLGHLECRPEQWNALLAAPGHKGLLGPLGSGILYVPDALAARMVATRQGGTGTQSERDAQPAELPEKFESGNHNVPALLGLGAGVRFLEQQGVGKLHQHLQERTGELLRGLQEIPQVTVHGPGTLERQTAVVSFSVAGYAPQEVAALLDAVHRIQCRAGFLCSPLVHELIGTADQGGVVRFSPGPFTTVEHTEAAVRAVAELAASAP